MTTSLKFAAIGIDHRHIFGMAQNMMDEGAEFVGWFTEGEPETLESFAKRFPGVPRVNSADELLSDPSIELVLISCIPRDRAEWAVQAMSAGKDVMTDKPGCTTLTQLNSIRECVAATGRIWSIDFSERFEVPSVTRASALVAEGAIGRYTNSGAWASPRANA